MKRAFLLFACLLAGCSLPIFSNSKSITEIGERFHTGLGRSSLEIILRRDGTTEMTCVFYGLDNGPSADSMQVKSISFCEDMFKMYRSGFVKKDGGDLSQTIKGRIEPEQFDRLAKLMVDNGYLWLSDRYEEPGLMDSPPTFTWIVYSKGKKQVSDQNNKGGPKLKEIEDAIYKTAGEITFK